MAADQEAFQQILLSLLSTDNDVRSQAEVSIVGWKFEAETDWELDVIRLALGSRFLSIAHMPSLHCSPIIGRISPPLLRNILFYFNYIARYRTSA